MQNFKRIALFFSNFPLDFSVELSLLARCKSLCAIKKIQYNDFPEEQWVS